MKEKYELACARKRNSSKTKCPSKSCKISKRVEKRRIGCYNSTRDQILEFPLLQPRVPFFGGEKNK